MSYEGKSRPKRLGRARNTSVKPDGTDKPLPAFGVCGNDAIHCRFSFDNPNLKGLINRRGSGKHDAANLQPFKHFFQIDGACRGCNAPVRDTRHTTHGRAVARKCRVQETGPAQSGLESWLQVASVGCSAASKLVKVSYPPDAHCNHCRPVRSDASDHR